MAITPQQIAQAGSESAHQKALFAWAALQHAHPLLSALRLMYAIPNGGKRDPITAARLKAEGVKAGVPDVHWPVACAGCKSLYIELKVGSNRPSAEQKYWADELRKCGHCVVTCWGWEAAARCLTDYANCWPVAMEYR